MSTSPSIEVDFEQPVVFFDGICNLCHGTVQFLLWADRNEKLRFASLQSCSGREILEQLGLSPEHYESVMLVERGRVHFRSTAVLQICRYLPWFFRAGLVFLLIPRFLRDWIYRWIAKNRYSLFGKKDQCPIPSPELSARFLE